MKKYNSASFDFKQLSLTFFTRYLLVGGLLICVSCGCLKITNTLGKSSVVNPAVGQKTTENPNIKNPEAVQEVLDGKRTEANAAWWEFDEEDATTALQSAIESGAKKVFVPKMGKDWIVRSIHLVSNQEIEFEEGVIIKAKRGDFKDPGSFLFWAKDQSNITLRGYGATFQMWKRDYQNPLKYTLSQWRHALSINNCTDITIMGLTIKDGGGDGICVAGGKVSIHPKRYHYSKDIYIKDVIFDNNHRQGISVISAENLIVEDCVFKNTWGTVPSAGVDFEPDQPTHRLVNCVFRNCSFTNNVGPGILLVLGNLNSSSEDISIHFEDCYVTSAHERGIYFIGLKDKNPGGIVEFENCVIENTMGHGLEIAEKSAEGARIVFKHCTWRNVSKHVRPKTTLWICHTRWLDEVKKSGGIDFIDCYVEDTLKRPFLLVSSEHGIYDITGHITVSNPHGASIDLGDDPHGITLEYEEGKILHSVR